MAAPTVAVFDGWLSKRLLQINPDVDLEVFVSYIRSIVESEDDVEEATEALNGILAEIVVRVTVLTSAWPKPGKGKATKRRFVTGGSKRWTFLRNNGLS